MDKILSKITEIIHTYESGQYKDLFKMHRELVCNMYLLSQKQVEYHVEWNQEYYLHKSTVNAVKERYANRVVPELYMCRKIMETARGVSIAMGYELKLN